MPARITSGQLKTASRKVTPPLRAVMSICPYSAECVEEEFCELRLYGVLGSLVDRASFEPKVPSAQKVGDLHQKSP
jgi:hypothetical protein